MKRALPILLLLIFLPFLTLQAEETPLIFELSRHDFGTIAEDGGKVCHTFACSNSQRKPVVILDISGGCHCTTATFQRQPILPGKSCEVEICFDPMNQPEGKFMRKIVVTTSQGRMLLTISGTITPRKKSLAEQYPMQLTPALQIESNHHAFGYVEHSKPIRSSFGIYNSSNRTISLRLVPTEQSGVLDLHYPTTLAPREQAVIDFGYSLEPTSGIYGTLSDVLSVEVDGAKSRYPLIINGIAIDERKNSTDKEWQKIQLSKNFLKFGTVKATFQTVSHTLAIRNIGLEPLIIRHIECSNDSFKVNLKGDKCIPTDSERTLEVSLIPAQCDFGAVTGSIMIVTNDPQQPVMRLRVTAIVER
ncbi:MAG: DUF1573 domain-containing protein [Alistipes sp.]|nr:DUF1573 domain-containing protein [Alistipes sp.]